MVRLAIALCFIFFAAAAHAGAFKVVDGDTFEGDGWRIDLLGIDAPEPRQPCYRKRIMWLCGQAIGVCFADNAERKNFMAGIWAGRFTPP